MTSSVTGSGTCFGCTASTIRQSEGTRRRTPFAETTRALTGPHETSTSTAASESTVRINCPTTLSAPEVPELELRGRLTEIVQAVEGVAWKTL